MAVIIHWKTPVKHRRTCNIGWQKPYSSAFIFLLQTNPGRERTDKDFKPRSKKLNSISKSMVRERERERERETVWIKVSSDTIIGEGATLIFKLVKMKFFRASQSSVVHIEAVLTSNQSPVWPAKLFERFIDTVVCKRCLSLSFRHHVDL